MLSIQLKTILTVLDQIMIDSTVGTMMKYDKPVAHMLDVIGFV